MNPAGLPHSEISGSKPVNDSPKLIAACHVLLRLPMPRHPPLALSSLSIKLDQTIKNSTYCNLRTKGWSFRAVAKAGAPDRFGTKDFLLLYYSIIKDQANFRTNVLRNGFSLC